MIEILETYLILESNSKEEVIIRKSKRANNCQTDNTEPKTKSKTESKTKSSPVQEQIRVQEQSEIDVHTE